MQIIYQATFSTPALNNAFLNSYIQNGKNQDAELAMAETWGNLGAARESQ